VMLRPAAPLAFAFSVVLLAGCSSRPKISPSGLAVGNIPSGTLCVTEGGVHALEGGRMEVVDPVMRAVAIGTGGDAAEIVFAYEGPTASDAPLANGELRRQIGLKLRAADTCNVVYVMWRLMPTSGLAVSVKRNPGMTKHAECHDGGYRMIKADREESVPEIREGEPHRLRATLDRDSLRALVDGRLAWEGKIGEDALAFEGPVGVRSDNGRFVFRVIGDRGSRAAECSGGEVVASK
jgi:hypothetical protein